MVNLPVCWEEEGELSRTRTPLGTLWAFSKGVGLDCLDLVSSLL